MRVMCGVWLSLLASATALCFPAVLGHRSCVARVNPAMARLAKPMAFGQWRSGNGDPDLLQALDAIEPTLSYQGWHKDVAEIEERYIQGLVPSEAFCELRRKQERHDARSCCGSKSWASSKQRSTTMAGKTRQPSIEEKLGRDVVPRTYTPGVGNGPDAPQAAGARPPAYAVRDSGRAGAAGRDRGRDRAAVRAAAGRSQAKYFRGGGETLTVTLTVKGI